MKKANPLLELVPGLLNTALSLVKDKTRDPETSFINEKIKKGVSVSSKRMLNLTGTGALIGYAIIDMQSNGINSSNLILAGIGAAYCIGMAWLTQKAENGVDQSTEAGDKGAE